MGQLHHSHAISPPATTRSGPYLHQHRVTGAPWHSCFLASFPAPILRCPANGPPSISSIDLACVLYLGLRRPSYDTGPYLQCTTCAIR